MSGFENSSSAVDVFSLDYEGRGVARFEGKTVFIKGALPTEQVRYRVLKAKKQFDEAELETVLQPSDERVVPRCGYFDTCGGCVLQHVQAQAQVAFKQRILEEQLERIGKVKPETILPPIYGMPWHYRDRARLSVGYDRQGRLSLGFQAKRSHDVVDVQSCLILPPHVSACLPMLKPLLQRWSDEKCRVRFVEFFNSEQLTVLNIAFHTRPSEAILASLQAWFEENLAGVPVQWQIWWQCGRKPAEAFYPKDVPSLSYRLPEFEVEMPYRPGDFTQINANLNALMVARAMKLLDIQPGERVADLFCGLGNFSLPMAKLGAEVVGIEGSESLVQRARENALINKCADKMSFTVADLFDTDEQVVAGWGRFDKMLLDPPRSGAYAVVNSLHTPYLPQKVVYISCNPSTFARDAAVLVGKGYVFKRAGVMNMFAQTAHIESIGVFEL